MKSILLLALAFSVSSAFAVGPAPEVNPLVLRYPHNKLLADPIFEGIVKLSNCSGSLVTFKGMPKSKKALVMTNGHCVGFTKMGDVITNKPVTRVVSVFDADKKLHKLDITRIVYATQSYTDVTFYETTMSYQEIEDQYNVEALTIEDSLTAVGTKIDVVSGYWEILTSCEAEAIAKILKEDIWVWLNSVRYSSDCMTKGGYSGSPVIARNTRTIVAIHNTGNNGKLDCSDNNPCEANPYGEVVFQGLNRRYGQQVYMVYSCLDENFDIDLGMNGCELPKQSW